MGDKARTQHRYHHPAWRRLVFHKGHPSPAPPFRLTARRAGPSRPDGIDADPGTDTRATLAIQEKHVYWKNRLPQELGDVKDTPDGFSMAVPIPVDDDGYFGRACPACERLFKMLHIEYEVLPDDLELTCPYCGERQEHSV